MKTPIVILISGNGSNLQAFIDAIAANELDAEIQCVISNKADAYGLTRAENHQIPTEVVPRQKEETRAAYDQRLMKIIEKYQPEFIILAGFMRILSKDFVHRFQGQLINIHPSLLPKYPGLNTHQKVIENQDEEHGCTVHYVTEEVDGGPIIAQGKLKVLKNETEERLKQRIHVLEHKIFPQTIQKLIKTAKKS